MAVLITEVVCLSVVMVILVLFLSCVVAFSVLR